MRSKQYTIPLKPIPWKRAGRSGTRVYDTQVNDKIAYGLYMIKCHGSAPIFDGPIAIDITFYMLPPKKTKVGYHHTTPDLDNLVKLLLDAIVSTSSIITDDRIISVIKAEKRYDHCTRTEFTIRKLE